VSSVAHSGRERKPRRKHRSSKYVDFDDATTLTFMADTTSHRLDLCVGGKISTREKDRIRLFRYVVNISTEAHS
jgi:hypothetical protein